MRAALPEAGELVGAQHDDEGRGGRAHRLDHDAGEGHLHDAGERPQHRALENGVEHDEGGAGLPLEGVDEPQDERPDAAAEHGGVAEPDRGRIGGGPPRDRADAEDDGEHPGGAHDDVVVGHAAAVDIGGARRPVLALQAGELLGGHRSGLAVTGLAGPAVLVGLAVLAGLAVLTIAGLAVLAGLVPGHRRVAVGRQRPRRCGDGAPIVESRAAGEEWITQLRCPLDGGTKMRAGLHRGLPTLVHHTQHVNPARDSSPAPGRRSAGGLMPGVAPPRESPAPGQCGAD